MRRSTTTKMTMEPRDEGRPVKKFVVTSSHTNARIGRDCNKPVGVNVNTWFVGKQGTLPQIVLHLHVSKADKK